MRKDSNIMSETGKIVSFIPTGEYYFSKGLKSYRRRDLKKAKKYFSRAFDLEPLEPIIACQLAIVETELGNYEQSNQLLHLILDELDSFMNECNYFLANNYAHLGMFKEAAEHTTAYLKENPDGEFAEDAEDLLEVIRLDGDLAIETIYEQDELITMQDKAKDLLEMGNFEKAISVLEEIIHKYPEFWSAYNNLALAYYYLGDLKKSHEILHDVLEKSPGNLHALCNLTVFMYYEKREDELNQLLEVLRKIRPLIPEHQFKLGATFALVGQFEDAYFWLKKLYKAGFQGDASFYYWLSHAAYQTGHQKTAYTVWEHVKEMSPEKEGSEPWNHSSQEKLGYEHHISSIVKRLNSPYEEDRLFGIFLLSVTDDKQKVTSHPDFCDIETLSIYEKWYLAYVLGMELTGQTEEKFVEMAHETALKLYNRYHPIGHEETGLFLLWFSALPALFEQSYRPGSQDRFAAATEYLWCKFREKKKSQKEIAEIYHISPSTLRKYVKFIEDLIFQA
ncbi:tetratricopeptide (TPR) repeat protein [Oikeobacillus pervagus]|uniref:Tetratricopeptide (TPR) repeat protein n=1 Tax=Oikeobacillus pervagus TaxID=1325931 RepID=A0AAJ1WH89_9BACI|nr:tetratricopeptide repeat protein [Oikeobacillus pervagus]MDQ0215957.1 tetratricopeptide (TPR) repeat protein [Oikeobacillus pervagus]